MASVPRAWEQLSQVPRRPAAGLWTAASRDPPRAPPTQQFFSLLPSGRKTSPRCIRTRPRPPTPVPPSRQVARPAQTFPPQQFWRGPHPAVVLVVEQLARVPPTATINTDISSELHYFVGGAWGAHSRGAGFGGKELSGWCSRMTCDCGQSARPGLAKSELLTRWS